VRCTTSVRLPGAIFLNSGADGHVKFTFISHVSRVNCKSQHNFEVKGQRSRSLGLTMLRYEMRHNAVIVMLSSDLVITTSTQCHIYSLCLQS